MVSTIWGESWDIPTELVSVGIVILVVLVVVLIVEGSSIPVNVNMNVGDFHVITDDTSEIELKIASLGQWLWGVSSLLVIQGEDTNIILTLGDGNLTRGTRDINEGGLGSEKTLEDVVVGKVSLIHDWESLHVSGFSFGRDKA